MVIDKQNPFDVYTYREENNLPLISLLIHTDSVSKMIVSKDKTLMKLLKLSEFPFLFFSFTPTRNVMVRQALKDYGFDIEFLTMECTDEQVSLQYSPKIGLLRFLPKTEELFFPIKENSNVATFESIMMQDSSYDYSVVSCDDSMFKDKYREVFIIDPNEAFDRIRTLLVNIGYYYPQPSDRVNEGMYYEYKTWAFCNGMLLRASSEYMKNSSDYENYSNQISSLWYRIEFIFRAADKICFYSYHSSNNDVVNRLVYHFGYFIVLITGLFDDLAWIIKILYSIDISRMKTELKHEKFVARIEPHNFKLYDLLMDKEISNSIKLFYPIRNSIQHRIFIDGAVIFKAWDPYSIDSTIIISKFDYEAMTEHISKKDLSKWGIEYVADNPWIKPRLFVAQALKTIHDIKGQVLDAIEEQFTTNDGGNSKQEPYHHFDGTYYF